MPHTTDSPSHTATLRRLRTTVHICIHRHARIQMSSNSQQHSPHSRSHPLVLYLRASYHLQVASPPPAPSEHGGRDGKKRPEAPRYLRWSGKGKRSWERGPRVGKGELLRYRVKGQRRQLRRKGRAGQRWAQQDTPQGAACVPWQWRWPLTWSPHAGVNHAARPAGLGEQLCHLPAFSGGQAFSAGSHPGRKPQGPPPTEGKIPWRRPTPAGSDPKSCVLGKWGYGAEAKQAGRPDFHSGASRRCLRQLPLSLQPPWGKHIWNRVCGHGREGGPITTTTTTTLAISIWSLGLSQCETLHLALDKHHLLKQSLFAPFGR